MKSFKLPVAVGIVAAAMLASGSPALAATASPATKPVARSAPKLVAAKPKPAAMHAVAARPAANGRMVQARLGNGKVVTYNCSLAGNQTKQVCKR